jgi:LysR family transcriptional regulator, benzoate and cis,cis-muconate-responsive activator of ben and cat genes
MRYDLKHLSTFVAVAEELNFHRAAERLTMAQPAVSRIVVELEDRLGVKLLERTTRRVRLTEPGRYLLEEAQAILDRIDVAENTVKLLATGTKAILRIGYTTITGHSLMPDITREFRKSNPDVRLELTYMTSPVMRDRILQDEIDLGFVVGSFQNSEIESRLSPGTKSWRCSRRGIPLPRRNTSRSRILLASPWLWAAAQNGRLSGVWLSTCSRTPDWS